MYLSKFIQYYHFKLNSLINFRIKNYTEITEVNLYAFVYRLSHEDLSPIYGTIFKTYIS